MNNLRAITLWQPWATFIALGFKKYETRSWSTRYCGKLAIHAAQRPIDSNGWSVVNQVCNLSGIEIKGSQLQQYGCVVAIANLTQCLEMTPEIIDELPELEETVGLWEPGRYAWKLEDVQIIEPIKCQGKQGLWVPPQLNLTVPTWADAIAHCEPEVQERWTKHLNSIGIDINSTAVRGGISSKEELAERLAKRNKGGKG